MGEKGLAGVLPEESRLSSALEEEPASCSPPHHVQGLSQL